MVNGGQRSALLAAKPHVGNGNDDVSTGLHHAQPRLERGYGIIDVLKDVGSDQIIECLVWNRLQPGSIINDVRIDNGSARVIRKTLPIGRWLQINVCGLATDWHENRLLQRADLRSTASEILLRE